MLVLAREENQVICIGDDIEIMVVRIDRGRVRLGITAPEHVKIDRLELRQAIDAQRKDKPQTYAP